MRLFISRSGRISPVVDEKRILGLRLKGFFYEPHNDLGSGMDAKNSNDIPRNQRYKLNKKNLSDMRNITFKG